jgi:glycosyltransferase 2 family protein
MRSLRILSLAAGLAILAALIFRVGMGATLATAARALGWQFLLICLPYALVMAVDTLGWRYAFPRDRAPFLRLVAARMAGEAVNVITAVLPVGGDAVKVWLLRSHVPYRESVASVIIAKTTITIAQWLFLLVGLLLAWALSMDSRLVTGMLSLMLVEVICVGGLFLVQVVGLMSRGAHLLSRFGPLQSVASVEQLDSTLQHFYRREWRRFSLSVGYHLLGWFLGVLETLLILHAFQIPASLAAAIVIETLGSAVRFATFFVPGSLGALEGANTGAFTALGLGASAGLGFSLVRRGRQVVWLGIGLVVLAAIRAGDRLAYARAHRSTG